MVVGVLHCEDFSKSGTGNLVKMGRIMKERREDFERKLQAVSSKTGLGDYVVFQNNDAKNMLLLVKNYLQRSKVNFTDWHAQNPELNPLKICGLN